MKKIKNILKTIVKQSASSPTPCMEEWAKVPAAMCANLVKNYEYILVMFDSLVILVMFDLCNC